MSATNCPVWCSSDHTKIPTHIGHIGQQQVGPDALDMVVVRVVDDATLGPCVLVATLRRSPIFVAPLMLEPGSALSLAELLDATGQPELGGLVREGADVLADRPEEPS